MATATTEIYTLSLHDALPIFDHQVSALKIDALARCIRCQKNDRVLVLCEGFLGLAALLTRHGPVYSKDRKSTRLNSSHITISYAVFCLKKKTIVHDGLGRFTG